MVQDRVSNPGNTGGVHGGVVTDVVLKGGVGSGGGSEIVFPWRARTRGQEGGGLWHLFTALLRTTLPRFGAGSLVNTAAVVPPQEYAGLGLSLVAYDQAFVLLFVRPASARGAAALAS